MPNYYDIQLKNNRSPFAIFWVYLGVRSCEVFICFVAIVRVRVCYVDFTGEFHRFLHRGRSNILGFDAWYFF